MALVYAKTDPKANYRQGMSLFLVDNTSPGLEVRKLDMLGRRSVGTYELTFNDVRVPAENLVGGENNGWKCVLAGLQAERAVAAACDCGSARGVFEMALAYAKERKQFTKQIGTFQALAHMLADMQTEIEAAWSLTLRAAAMVSAGQDALREITMAKLAASEAYVKAANNGMQIMGGFGYSMEFDMQRHYRDARSATVADPAQPDCRIDGAKGLAAVIPGRAKGANPESSLPCAIWIPGPTLRVVPE